MLRTGMHRFEAAETLAEVMDPDQAAFHQGIERTVDGRQSDRDAILTQSTLNAIHREVLTTGQDDGRDHIARLGSREVAILQPGPEPQQEFAS